MTYAGTIACNRGIDQHAEDGEEWEDGLEVEVHLAGFEASGCYEPWSAVKLMRKGRRVVMKQRFEELK